MYCAVTCRNRCRHAVQQPLDSHSGQHGAEGHALLKERRGLPPEEKEKEKDMLEQLDDFRGSLDKIQHTLRVLAAGRGGINQDTDSSGPDSADSADSPLKPAGLVLVRGHGRECCRGLMAGAADP